MRNLTIKREKRFVACLGTMKVYIEDPTANDLMINGCACRKLGTLKNGEEKTFEIAEAAAKVFVIADKLSKGFSNEFYPLPEGQEDIVLTGRNCYNPASGNPFRFDGVTDEAVLKNRKKGTRVGIIVLIVSYIAALLGFAIGFASTSGLFADSGAPKTFSTSGMKITLTDEFDKFLASGYTAGYESREAAVLVLKEEFSLLEGFASYSLADYGTLVLKNNGLDAQLKTENGLTYFEYEVTNDETYHYVAVIYKGTDAFWLIQFATLEEDAAEYRPTIFDWAKTVTFN